VIRTSLAGIDFAESLVVVGVGRDSEGSGGLPRAERGLKRRMARVVVVEKCIVWLGCSEVGPQRAVI